MLLLLGVALVLAAGAFLLVSRLRKRTADQQRVAVAVFVNRTGDASLEPLGSMLADWVTRGLTQAALVDVVDVGAIHVQGRSSDGSPTDPYELARRNGAGTVVAGSYYLATDTLVVRATVEDALAGTVLQTVPPVHVPAREAVRALDQVKERVLVALGGVFDVRYAGLTARSAAPSSFEAYQEFLAGQEAYWHGRPPPEVQVHFAQAAALDSTFTAPAVWLALLGANGGGCGLTDSVAAALQSSRDRLSAFDRLTLGISSARCRNDWKGGYQLALEQARLRPRSTYAVYTAGFFALTSNHLQAAHDLLSSLDPERDLGWLSDPAHSVYWRDLGSAQHLVGEYQAELQAAERQIRSFPDRLGPRLAAARALAGLRRSRDALAHVEAAAKLAYDPAARVESGLTPGLVSYVAAAEMRVHGDTSAWRAAAQRAVDWYRADPARLEASWLERYHLTRTLVVLDLLDEALAVMAFGPGADTTEPVHTGLRGVIAAHQGRRSAAALEDARLARIGEDPARALAAGMQRARIAAALGDVQTALDLFEEAAARGVVRVPFGHDIHSDPLLDALRGDPRFERVNRGESERAEPPE